MRFVNRLGRRCLNISQSTIYTSELLHRAGLPAWQVSRASSFGPACRLGTIPPQWHSSVYNIGHLRFQGTTTGLEVATNRCDSLQCFPAMSTPRKLSWPGSTTAVRELRLSPCTVDVSSGAGQWLRPCLADSWKFQAGCLIHGEGLSTGRKAGGKYQWPWASEGLTKTGHITAG